MTLIVHVPVPTGVLPGPAVDRSKCAVRLLAVVNVTELAYTLTPLCVRNTVAPFWKVLPVPLTVKV